ncbi:MAG: hypothetical protein AABZ60_17860 [Planctomycetota bacterium]
MLPLFVSLLFFLFLHSAINLWFSSSPFHIRLKISRGFASLILSLVGFYVLYQGFFFWRQAFIIKHTAEDTFFNALVYGLMGHFLADFFWLAYGYSKEKSKPRLDLIIHHIFGFLVCAYALYLNVGYLMIGIGMTDEMMPVTTGIHSLGQILGKKSLEQRSVFLRLVVLLGWRLPLWIFVFTILLREFATGNTRVELQNIYPICFIICLFMIALDLYWSRSCIKNLRVIQKIKVSK